MGNRHICSCLLRKKLREKRGSQVVEAAIFLPILIIAVLSLAFMMRYMQASDRIHDHLTREAQTVGVTAHFIPLPLAAAELSWQAGTADCQDYWLAQRSTDVKENDTIFLTADYAVKNRLPLDYIGSRQIRQKIWIRAWVGSEQTLSPMPWSEMETDANAQPVFVFPRAGERYHEETCIFVDNTPVERMLTKELGRQYGACKICDAKVALLYSFVYCFPKTGEVYHIASCPLVDKYVIELEKTDAEEKGYTPCKKCQ